MTNSLENKRNAPGYLFAVGATAIWSANFIIARGLSDSIPPVSLAFFRWVVAVLAFLPFALKPLVRERHLVRGHLPYLSVTALLGISVFNTLIYIAGHTTTAVNLSLIAITFPVFIVILSRIILGEKITVNKGVGILLVGTGVVMLITKGRPSILLEITFAVGDLWMLSAAMIFALFSILLKRKPEAMSILAFQFSTFILGLLFLFPFFAWEYLTSPPLVFEARTLGAILYLGVFASLTAFFLWNNAIQTVGPARAGMIYYTLPLFSGILAHFILGEAIGALHLYSAVLIVSGILTANYSPRNSK